MVFQGSRRQGGHLGFRNLAASRPVRSLAFGGWNLMTLNLERTPLRTLHPNILGFRGLGFRV